ncbi:MAG: hypothetical protein QOF16_793 [Actinomycetota bacterium]|jgi:hypothetical protein|nr:hypothetical protein [Actinomycetota bacterium]MEA2487139.1 hypothetical protein [Actinomycetota bacterium]
MLRNKVALTVVALAATATIGGLGAASANPGHGKHGPCEHGRHRHNPHCVTTSPTATPTATSTEGSTPSPEPSETESSQSQ